MLIRTTNTVLAEVPIVRARLYKHYTHEGGIATPCIAHWPNGLKIRLGGVRNEAWHFIDVLPTLAAVAGAKAPPD